MDFAQAQEAVNNPDGMDAIAAAEFLDLLMSAQLDPEQGGQLLRDLAQRGETAVEVAAFVRGLLARAARVPWEGSVADCCGTGGSGRTRFNVSTTAAVVAAAAGIPVAKHGNKGSRRANGSFDLLEALGVPLNLAPHHHQQLLAQHGLTFCFARAHHPAVAAVVPYRQAAGGRTIFNLAGPLANPAHADCQVIGVCDLRTADVVAGALWELGHRRAVVVTGEPGWDEFVLDAPNRLLELSAQGVSERIMPAPQASGAMDAVAGGDVDENITVFRELLHGKREGAIMDLVCLSAGALIDTWHGRSIAATGEGVTQARELLRSGRCERLFAAYLLDAQGLSNA